MPALTGRSATSTVGRGSRSGAVTATARSQASRRSEGKERGARTERAGARARRGPRRARFGDEGDVEALPPAGTLPAFQHAWTVAHEEATALVRKHYAPDFVDQPVNRWGLDSCDVPVCSPLVGVLLLSLPLLLFFLLLVLLWLLLLLSCCL